MNTRLWRADGIALVAALAGNTLLWPIVGNDSGDEDVFARIVAVASGVAAVALIVTHYLPRARQWIGESLLLAVAVWTANLIEFALEDQARWESRVRGCGFYAAFALISVAMYLVSRPDETTT